MKKVIINTGLSRKGAQYSNKKQKQLVTCLLWIVAVCLILWAWAEPASASTGFGLSLATMAAIVNIDDVTDRDTHGSEIAYQVVLIGTHQIADPFDFPQPNVDRQVTIGKSILKPGEAAHYFEAHAIPTLVSTSEKGDITTNGTNTFVIVVGGDRAEVKDFIENYAGGKFILLYKHIKDTVWHILGEPERPMILGNTEHKDDTDGRYTNMTFTRNSVYLDNLVQWASSGSGQSATTETIQDLLNGNTAT